ncbi:MAG: hypothetical protein EP335_13300 [Alphaproteobacteria bacterium]|nr:MAG: hypothetical protein EP335_13300 [Alphaproteobacteria bacterium]
MNKHVPFIIAASLFAALPASAADCGEPPLDLPNVPNGANASADDIRIARDGVVAYSHKVDEYLACMDQRANVILPYLTKEQKTRWDEDLTNLHNSRRDLQVKMNEAIRDYRRAQN